MPQQFATHQPDDDVPMRPNPADDALSSAQARHFWQAAWEKQCADHSTVLKSVVDR